MRFEKHLFTVFLVFSCIKVSVLQNDLKCDDINTQKLCVDQDLCDSCLESHICCNYCYDKSYTGRRCNTKNQLLKSSCNETMIEFNQKSRVITQKDKPFTTKGEIVQIKPQNVLVQLKKGVPTNVSFTYKLAENYPLDLYYLGDLSMSMKPSMKIFASLGQHLPGNLTKLTKHYKLAFGSFGDKPAMPFYYTDEESTRNPCSKVMDTCAPGYSFRHHLNFTAKTEDFLDVVSSSKVTANVDDLDGALDALLQVLACNETINFSPLSRKIILLPTDSLLHSAGDGILAGAVRKPDLKCLLDQNGEYTKSLINDYPALDQIEFALRKNKVNIIFAVKTLSKMHYYLNMTRDTLKGYAFVGELQEDATNIVDLITKGYYNFAQTVSFMMNTTEQEYIDVKFFADCSNLGIYNETSICYGLDNREVNFKVQLTAKHIPEHTQRDTLYVEEKNINEKLTVNVEYVSSCQCSNYKDDGNKFCGHGTYRCGRCYCQEGWSGSNCSENCENFDFRSCRSYETDPPSKICFENGDCKCGHCECELPYSGKYCQYECPFKRIGPELIICGGPSKGYCHNGICMCQDGFAGEDCTCSESESECSFDGAVLCNEQGECKCNKCNCNQGYTGKYCEKNTQKQKNIICEAYNKDVQNFLTRNDSSSDNANLDIIDESSKNELSCGYPTDHKNHDLL
uniref:Integrin beta n=1 Tax=Diabrotica virgifera virgifera TaxID=50390 RepID=A0A6P7G622_DIAVI